MLTADRFDSVQSCSDTVSLSPGESLFCHRNKETDACVFLHKYEILLIPHGPAT